GPKQPRLLHPHSPGTSHCLAPPARGSFLGKDATSWLQLQGQLTPQDEGQWPGS
ncbi:hypothetical protein P7K49_026560, partial [Saguinus oedipus]